MIKLNKKIKKAVCLLCVFVMTFLMTTTAFADFIVANSNFLGKYTCVGNYTPGYIQVSDGHIYLYVYMDDDRGIFVTVTSTEGKLSNSNRNLYAIFGEVKKVQLNGSPAYGGGYIENYTVIGDVDVSLFWSKITILPYNTTFKYAK